jgi:hypothetical protein
VLTVLEAHFQAPQLDLQGPDGFLDSRIVTAGTNKQGSPQNVGVCIVPSWEGVSQ